VDDLAVDDFVFLLQLLVLFEGSFVELLGLLNLGRGWVTLAAREKMYLSCSATRSCSPLAPILETVLTSLTYLLSWMWKQSGSFLLVLKLSNIEIYLYNHAISDVGQCCLLQIVVSFFIKNHCR
jgi:hypothetical protein